MRLTPGPGRIADAAQIGAHGLPLVLVALGLADAPALIFVYSWEIFGLGLSGVLVTLVDRQWTWHDRLNNMFAVSLVAVAGGGACLQLLDNWGLASDIVITPALWLVLAAVVIADMLDVGRLYMDGANLLKRDDYEVLYALVVFLKPLLLAGMCAIGIAIGFGISGSSGAAAIGPVVLRSLLDIGYGRLQHRFSI